MTTYVHLDTYKEPIHTRISRPTLIDAAVCEAVTSPHPTEHIPWPPTIEVLVRSVLDAECDRLCRQDATMEYVRSFWAAHQRLPALTRRRSIRMQRRRSSGTPARPRSSRTPRWNDNHQRL